MDNNLLFDINQYEKKEKIGGDTYGEVFKVIDKNTNEQYAAKISLYEENLDLTREINNLAAIDHPSILKFIGYSPVNFYGEPKPVIITEFLPNNSLHRVLEDERKGLADQNWDDTKKLIIIYGIASGMQFLHKNNIIHRDLKPSNILLDDDLYPKIADFGFSKKLHQNLESLSLKSNEMKGTPAYMAPEIFNSTDYSFATDVYAFGIMVNEILTSDPPYPKNITPLDLSYKVINGYRPKIPEYIPQCYKDLIEKCWLTDPNQRPLFDEIVEDIKSNDKYIYEGIDKEEFLNYVDFIEGSEGIFNSKKRLISDNDLIIMRNREVPKKINKAKRNFFYSLFTPIKPTPESFFPKDQFDLLDEKSRNLVNEANNNPNQQFLLGKYLIEGEYGFRRNIEIAIKYLNYSIDESCIESAVYYSNILIKGDIIPQDIKKAISILSKFLSTNDPNILFLYAKIMKKQKNIK